MIVYNVTTKLDWSIHEDWLIWMKSIHIPEMLDTGLFTDSRILRLLEVDDAEGPTYAVQYYADSMASYHQYIAAYAPVQRAKTIDQWGDKFIAFRTLMETVH